MRMVQCTIACLAFFLTAQTTPEKSTEPTAIVVAHPVKVVKFLFLEPDEGHLGFYKVRMKVDRVIHGKFKKKYFHAAILVHLPQYVFLTRKWVAIISPEYKDGITPIVARVKSKYCFADEIIAEFGLRDRIGTPYRVDEHPDGACWDLSHEDE